MADTLNQGSQKDLRKLPGSQVFSRECTGNMRDFPFQQHPGVLDRWSRDCGCQQPAYNKDCFPRLGCVVAAEIDTVELDKCIGAGACRKLARYR